MKDDIKKIACRKEILKKSYESDIFNIKKDLKDKLCAKSSKQNEFITNKNRNIESNVEFNMISSRKKPSMSKTNTNFTPKYNENDPKDRLSNEFYKQSKVNTNAKNVRGLLLRERKELNKNAIDIKNPDLTPLQRKVVMQFPECKDVSYVSKSVIHKEDYNNSIKSDIKPNTRTRNNFSFNQGAMQTSSPISLTKSVPKQSFWYSGIDWMTCKSEIYFKNSNGSKGRLNKNDNSEDFIFNSSNSVSVPYRSGYGKSGKYFNLSSDCNQLFSSKIDTDYVANKGRDEIRDAVSNYCNTEAKTRKMLNLTSLEQDTKLFVHGPVSSTSTKYEVKLSNTLSPDNVIGDLKSKGAHIFNQQIDINNKYLQFEIRNRGSKTDDQIQNSLKKSGAQEINQRSAKKKSQLLPQGLKWNSKLVQSYSLNKSVNGSTEASAPQSSSSKRSPNLTAIRYNLAYKNNFFASKPKK